MSMFGSFFWLWSIIGLLGLVMLYSLGAFMNMAGFLSPGGRFGRCAAAAQWPKPWASIRRGCES